MESECSLRMRNISIGYVMTLRLFLPNPLAWDCLIAVQIVSRVMAHCIYGKLEPDN